MAMTFGLTFVLRLVQLLFAVIVLGLTGYVASRYNGGNYFRFHSSPSSVNFNIFLSIWTIVVVILLLVATRLDKAGRHIGHRFVVLGLDALTALFWFAGFIALAAHVGVRKNSNSVIGCQQGAVAFGAFLWALFTATAVMYFLGTFRGQGRATKSVGSHNNSV